jgi:hypothetical protein
MKEIIARAKRGTPHGAVPQDLRYDVKKTDSMISPYVATVTFIDENSIAGPTSDGRAVSLQSPVTAQFAWQDDRWVLKDLGVSVFGEHSMPANGMPADSSLHDWVLVFGGGE